MGDLEGIWYVIDLTGPSCYCYSSLASFRIDCGEVVKIGKVIKGQSFYGFSVFMEEPPRSVSHFEGEIDHNYRVFVYPFLTEAQAKCEIMEIRSLVRKWKIKKEAWEKKNAKKAS